MRIKLFNITLSATVLKNAVILAAVITTLYILFNIFSYTLLKYYLNANLDSKINHEIENIYNSIEYLQDSIIIVRPNEFNESDLTLLTEDPFFLQIYSTKGKILLQSKNIKLFTTIDLRYPSFFDEYFYEDYTSAKGELRIGYKKIYDETGRHAAFLQLSSQKSAFNKIVRNIILFHLLAFPFMLVVILAISLIVSKKTFAPVNKIIELAGKISATHLNERLSYNADPDDELGKLRETLNNLFERLETQVKQISSFSDNASHQLMTPLTAKNSELDFLLRDENKTVSERESLLMLKEQTVRMISIIKSLLLLARNRNSDLEQKTVFNFSKMITEQIKENYKDHKIEIDVADEIYLRGKPDYFLMAVQNLIDNALKYSNDDWITISALQSNNQVKIRIEDFGMGIDDVEKEKIFERFYRSKKAEKLGIKGYGLGLSLARSIISSMQGTIEIQDNKPRGTKFIITLPALEIE